MIICFEFNKVPFLGKERELIFACVDKCSSTYRPWGKEFLCISPVFDFVGFFHFFDCMKGVW